MSENLPTNVQLAANAGGTVSFAPEVIATIAGVAATEVEGVASMYGGGSGFADMFSRKSSAAKTLTKGVRVDFNESSVGVYLTIIVNYGSPIPEVTLAIQENVKKAIETMSGLTVSGVNVHVQGLSFERENQKAIEEQKRQRIAAQKAESAAEAPEEEPGEAPFWPEHDDPQDPVEDDETPEAGVESVYDPAEAEKSDSPEGEEDA